MIRNRNFVPDSAVASLGRVLQLIVPANALGAAYIMAAIAGNAGGVQAGVAAGGFTNTLVAGIVQNSQAVLAAPHSVAIVRVGATGGTFTVVITGFNQFQEPINETLTIPNTATTTHTDKVFSRVTSIVTTAAPNSADTISAGWLTAVGGLTAPKVALPCKIVSTASLKFIAQPSSASYPTCTFALAPGYTCAFTGTAPTSNPTGLILVWTDEQDPGL